MAKPNILFLTWHDAGRWFGCYGNPHVHTPHVDQLAAEGCRFSQTFSACAICSPSRAALMTGRYCQDNGVMFLTNTVNNNRLHRTERHLCRILKEDHGYDTALFGVQHEAAHEHVTEILNPDERFLTDPWPSSDQSAAALAEWLRKRATNRTPFYAQIGFSEAHLGSFYSGHELPHYPWTQDEAHGLEIPAYLNDTAGSRKTVANLQGLIRRGDAALGRLLETLRTTGLEANTLVVMGVDHGVGLPAAKTWCYDAGLGVAWILRHPRLVPAGTVVEALTTQVDVLPTLLDLAGLPVPANVQGLSFADHVRGRRQDAPRQEVFSHMVETTRSLRTAHYKFIRNFRPRHVQRETTADVAPEVERRQATPAHVELYDLGRDPQEFHNLADDPAQARTCGELNARLWDFLLDHQDFVVHEPVNSDWQKETRRHLEAHCAAVGRQPPVVDH